jgi:hypothetical protein
MAEGAGPREGVPPDAPAGTPLAAVVGAGLWWVAMAVLFVCVARSIEPRITWYLAVDQLGYLTFARDLLQGRIFHEWAPLEGLRPLLPPQTDVLAQTYVYDQGRLHCRYAPGFPLLLAGWMGSFGEDAAAYLNPTIFLLLLAVLAALQRRVFPSRWHAGVGTALVTLFPTGIHLWAFTVTRDLSGHLFAFGALLSLLGPGRTVLAGVALGFAVTIRPDAVLYLVPAALLLRQRGSEPGARRRAVGGAVLGLACGILPLVAYNAVATGNPLRVTQGMELRRFFADTRGAEPPAADAGAVVDPSPGWRGTTSTAVSGGGLRLANVPTVLPANLRTVHRLYGTPALALAIWGGVLAAIQRRRLAAIAIPYAVVALLFFSCWGHANARYLMGVFPCLSMLIVEGVFGTADLVQALRRRQRTWAAGGLTLATGAGILGLTMATAATGSPEVRTLSWVLAIGAATAVLAAMASTRRPVATPWATIVMLALVLLASATTTRALARPRALFQRAEVRAAQANFARLVEPGAVVLTTEAVGRPAENIEYYTRAHALYLTDLRRWRMHVETAMAAWLAAGLQPYLFFPTVHPHHAPLVGRLRDAGFALQLVASIPPAEALGHFVGAPFHRGVAMTLYRVTPAR